MRAREAADSEFELVRLSHEHGEIELETLDGDAVELAVGSGLG
jgi:hypothetical protein